MLIATLLAFVLPLGLDSFAVAAAIGASGRLSTRARWRIVALFVVFEAGMPLIGLGLGAPLARVIGNTADYVAAAAVVGIGVWMLARDDSGEEQDKAARLVSAHGTALIALGVSISLDELAIGFSLGLTHLPPIPVVVAVGVQTFAVAQLGMYLGSRIGERYREGAERLAGIVLIALGLFVAAQRLLG